MHIPVELPPCDCMPQYLAVLHIKSHPAPPSLSSLYTASVWQPSTLHFQRPMPAVAHYILRAQSIFKKKSCTKNKAICTMVKFDSRQSPASPSMPPNTPFWMLPKKGLFKHSFSKSMCTGIGLCPKVTALGQVVNTALLWQGRVYICQSVFFFYTRLQ